jgi:RNA polymerase sigma-70 factor (ECF subfamily)
MKNLILLSDQQLISLYFEGDCDALSALIIRNKEKLYTSIYLLVKDKYLADDIFQDLCIRVIDNLKKGHYTEEGKFLPWVMRIAHNMCLDHFRKVKRMPVIKTNDDLDIFEALSFSSPSAEDKMVSNQRHDRVMQMLEMLPAEQREVIILRHYSDMSFKNIADLMHVSINTALGRMRYGLNNLRKIMAEKQIAM